MPAELESQQGRARLNEKRAFPPLRATVHPVRRRHVLALLGGALVFQPSSMKAQQPGRTYRLGFVVQQPRPKYTDLFEELGRLGFVEDRNLIIDPRGFELSVDRLEPIAVEVASAKPDAIFAGGDAAARAAQRATATIPILAIADDVVSNRLTGSLARPRGNLTGVSILAGELNGKRQDLLAEMLSGARHIGALIDPATTTPEQLHALIDAARSRGLQLSVYRAANRDQIIPAMEEARADGVQGLNVFASALLNTNRTLIIERNGLARIPAIYQFPEHCEEGGLAGYGTRLSRVFRQVAGMIAKVLAGTNATELPVEQPTQLEFCLNLRTASGSTLTPVSRAAPFR